MAYGSRPRRRSRRSFARRRPVARRVRRMPYRKRSFRPKRGMSRRRVLNISSNKKRDNMAPFAATGATGVTGAIGPALVPGNTGGVYLWCATARDRLSGVGDPNASSVRTTDSTYMRGLKEKIFFQTNTPASWRWRRICFEIKNSFTFTHDLESSNGWTRYLWNSAGTARTTDITTLIFEGAQNVDWIDVFTAKVDTSRVKIHRDFTRVLSSGNQNGKFFQDNRWYAMNKTLLYANDENGEAESSDKYASNGRFGMGNYFVVDFFDCTDTSVDGSSAATSTLAFRPEATLYWHEK